MTAMNEELILDADGIPILTDLVYDDEMPGDSGQQPRDITPAEIADRLLSSDSFRQQIDVITITLTQNVRHQVEQTLLPAIEQAIILALEDSDSQSAKIVRQQLEAALPTLIAQALEK